MSASICLTSAGARANAFPNTIANSLRKFLPKYLAACPKYLSEYPSQFAIYIIHPSQFAIYSVYCYIHSIHRPLVACAEVSYLRTCRPPRMRTAIS